MATGHKLWKAPISTRPPWGLTESNPHRSEVHSWLGWGSSSVWFVRCFIFHHIPLLLGGCTPAGLKLILWAGGGLTRPRGHSLLDNKPSVSFPFSLGRLSPLGSPFFLGGGVGRHCLFCFPLWQMLLFEILCRPSCIRTPNTLPQLTDLWYYSQFFHFKKEEEKKKRSLLNHICLKLPLMGAGNPVG